MFATKPFVRDDLETARDMVNQLTMGTLVSLAGNADGEAAPLPFRLLGEGDEARLVGHMDKRNPLWRLFEENSKALVVFWGPNSYISPSLYTSSPRVPTWTYLTLHIKGLATPFHDPGELNAHLSDLVSHMEPANSGWSLPQVAPYKDKLIGGIVGVSIKIENITAQVRLAQHNTAEDRRALFDGLSRGSLNERAVAEQMELFGFVPSE